ncbi:MAG: hemin uptake protein HemP [Roseicyclus sp.]
MTFQTTPSSAQASSMLSPGQPVHDARHLTGDEGTAFILLDGKTYTLRITKAGKLILTK